MELSEIRDHWEQAGKDFQTEGMSTPTSRDPYLGKLEEDNILYRISGFDSVLEIGCGDGSHTISYAKKVKNLCGIDVAKSLITRARERMRDESNVELSVGSVLDLSSIYKQKFDCVISQRCLINLPSWQYQQLAILECHEVLKEGGIFLLTEGFEEGLSNLNMVRKNFSLPEIKTVGYNRNLIREQFEKFITPCFTVIVVQNYGLYMFLSRVFHPLAVFPDEPKHDSRLNEVAMKVSQFFEGWQFEKYSFNLFYVLRKK